MRSAVARSGRRVASGIVLASLALTACSGPSAPDAPPGAATADVPSRGTASASPEASTAPIAPPGSRYVALGDSYSAAPGVGAAAGPAACARTDANYAHLLAARSRLDLVDVTCSGATTDDLAQSQDDGVPPQFDALTADTAIVTLGTGGNDNGLFSALILRCAGFGGSRAAAGDCADDPRFAEPGLTAEFDGLTSRIASAVDEVRRRAPRAKVVVVGYPQIAPASGTCDALPLRAADLAFVHELNRRLDRSVEQGARRARALFADVWTPSTGHDACSADPWIAGFRPVGPAIPLHPYRAYEEAAADAVATTLTRGS